MHSASEQVPCRQGCAVAIRLVDPSCASHVAVLNMQYTLPLPWQEVKVLAAVEGHPNITTYYDSWSEPTLVGEYQHIKLELCGESLGGHVKAKRALPNQELWDITQQVRDQGRRRARGLGCDGLWG